MFVQKGMNEREREITTGKTSGNRYDFLISGDSQLSLSDTMCYGVNTIFDQSLLPPLYLRE